MIIGIVAVDNNWAIGKNNGLLFKLPKDMKRFTKITTDHHVAMGLNTLMSFPRHKPLKDRWNIVLCPKGTKIKDCICVHTLGGLFSYIGNCQNDVYIIGGASIYKQMLPYYDKVLVTKVDASDPEATAFFPNLDENENFIITEESNEIEDNGYKTRYITYERINRDED